MAFNKIKADWTTLAISENAPEEIKQAMANIEAARAMESDARDVIATALAKSGKISIPQGHEIKVSSSFGKLSYAVVPRTARKVVSL